MRTISLIIATIALCFAIPSLIGEEVKQAEFSFKYNHYFGQDSLPLLTPMKSKIYPHLDEFRIDKFLLGWHWGGPQRISDALNCNQQDVGRNQFIL